MTNYKKLLAGAVAISLSGCAGRAPNPVALVQPYDDSSSCPTITAEIAANEAKARSLGGQAETHNATNAAVVVVGAVLFWPALFALDLTDYEKVEAKALRDRDNHLQQLAEERGCYKPKSTTPTTAGQLVTGS